MSIVGIKIKEENKLKRDLIMFASSYKKTIAAIEQDGEAE